MSVFYIAPFGGTSANVLADTYPTGEYGNANFNDYSGAYGLFTDVDSETAAMWHSNVKVVDLTINYGGPASTPFGESTVKLSATGNGTYEIAASDLIGSVLEGPEVLMPAIYSDGANYLIPTTTYFPNTSGEVIGFHTPSWNREIDLGGEAETGIWLHNFGRYDETLEIFRSYVRWPIAGVHYVNGQFKIGSRNYYGNPEFDIISVECSPTTIVEHFPYVYLIYPEVPEGTPIESEAVTSSLTLTWTVTDTFHPV